MRMSSAAGVARALALVVGISLALANSTAAQGGGRGQGPPPGGRGNGPVRDTPPSSQDIPAGTASIVGTVVVAGSGAPARHARVSLSGDMPRAGRSVTTDDEGRYAFTSLPAGRFTLSASKPGHLNVTYGQRVPGSGRPGTPIQLEDGQRLSIALQMPKGGVIAGTVLDEHGDAVPGTNVRVLRYTMQGGARTLQNAGSDATDDRGMYRIYGLLAGDYVVCAAPRISGPGVVADRIQEAVAALAPQAGAAAGEQAAAALAGRLALASGQSSEESSAGYAPVFYPGTTIASSATSVPLGIGEERVGVDFQLQLVSLARVEGTVVWPAGQQGGLTIQLINVGDDIPGIGDSATRVDSNGSFRFANVAPGQYTIVARTNGGGIGPIVGAVLGGRGGPGGPGGPPAGRGGDPRGAGGPRLWATAEVSVDGRNITNVVLALQQGFSISGRVEFRGASSPPTDLSRVRVTLTPADVTPAGRQLASSASGVVDENGRFTIDGVVPGRYRLVGGGPAGWLLESAIVGGQDALDMPVDIRSSQNAASAVVTYTDQQTSLSGAATNTQGQAVSDYTLIVYPSDSRYWLPQSRRIRSIRPATDGTFVLNGLPPGDYRIAPVLDPEPGSWFDASFLQQLDGAAERFTLTDGEKKVQNIRVGGA